MATLADAVAAFKDAIASRFPGAGGETDVAFELGTPFPVDGMIEAQANELISRLANMVPVITDAYCERGIRTVEKMYQLLLVGATPRADSSSIALFEFVKAEAARDFDLQEIGAFGVADKYHPVAATPHNWFDLSAAGNWTHQRIAASDQPATVIPLLDERLLQWWVVPPDDDDLIQTLKRPVTLDSLESVQKRLVDPRVVEPGTVSPGTIDPLTVSPGRFDFSVLRGLRHLAVNPAANQVVRDELLASPVFLRRATRRFRPELDLAVDSGLLAVDNGVLVAGAASAAGDGVTHTQGPDAGGAVIAVRDEFTPWNYTELVVDRTDPKPVVTRNLSIEFDICVLSLRRDWLSDSLLVLRDWFVPGFPKAAFSNGLPVAQNNGLLGAIPTACVMVRDVKISATWTPEDIAVLNRSISAGPFSLLGREFDSASGTITVPGLQAVAWVFASPPELPPLGDPSLPA